MTQRSNQNSEKTPQNPLSFSRKKARGLSAARPSSPIAGTAILF